MPKWKYALERVCAPLVRAIAAIGITVVILLLIVAATILLIYRLVYYAPGVEELGPHIDEYVSDTGLTDVSELAGPYRVGKLVAVDPRGRQLDTRLQKALPAELRAAQHDEVGTIIWISCSEHLVGRYKDVGSNQERGWAYQGTCEITIIDRAAAQIVERRTFNASSPPSTNTGVGDVHTQVDIDKIVQFLIDLPDELPRTPTPVTAPALVPGSTMTVRLTGPDSGIYSTTEAPYCTRHEGNPLDKWEVISDAIPYDEHSLGDLSFSGWLGDSPIDVESAMADLITTVRIGPIFGGRTYMVSKIEGGSGTFSIDDRGASATITFTGKTASGVFMAWTVECLTVVVGQTASAPDEGEISQFATGATASSQYSEPRWSAMQAVGAPDTAGCGDLSSAWASLYSSGKDWLLLTYDQPVIPTRIVIYQTYNPGAVSLVEVLDEAGNSIIVYEADLTIVSQCPYMLEIKIQDVNKLVRSIRITIDQSIHNDWSEIDAVQLLGEPK